MKLAPPSHRDEFFVANIRNDATKRPLSISGREAEDLVEFIEPLSIK